MADLDAVIKEIRSLADVLEEQAPTKKNVTDVAFLNGQAFGLRAAANVIEGRLLSRSRRWCDLKPGDEIICPSTGQPETVRWTAKLAGGGRFEIRTTGSCPSTHDHTHTASFNETVKLYVEPTSD